MDTTNIRFKDAEDFNELLYKNTISEYFDLIEHTGELSVRIFIDPWSFQEMITVTLNPYTEEPQETAFVVKYPELTEEEDILKNFVEGLEIPSIWMEELDTYFDILLKLIIKGRSLVHYISGYEIRLDAYMNDNNLSVCVQLAQESREESGHYKIHISSYVPVGNTRAYNASNPEIPEDDQI